MTRRRAKQAAAAAAAAASRSRRSDGSDDLPCSGGVGGVGGSFYVSASGRVTGSDESQNSIFAKQLPHIREALGEEYHNYIKNKTC